MKELLNSSLYFGVTVSIAGYGIGLFLKRKFKWGFLNPLLLAIIFVIIVLQLLFKIPGFQIIPQLHAAG